MCKVIYDEQQLTALGDLLTGAKINMWNNYRNHKDNQVASFNVYINLMGDPLCWVWTGIPGTLNVTAPDDLRFKRLRERARENDPQTEEAFKKLEKKEGASKVASDQQPEYQENKQGKFNKAERTRRK